MNVPDRHKAIAQLRRLLRRIDRSHTNDPEGCPTCSLQQLSAQLIEELENEAAQFDDLNLQPGAASVLLATEAVLGLVYLMGARDPDTQGRTVQAALDHIGGLVLDLLAQDEIDASLTMQDGEPGGGMPPPTGRRGSLH